MADAAVLSSGIEADDQFEAFRDAVSRSFVPLRTEAGGDVHYFHGAVSLAELGPLRLAEVTADAHVVGRTSRLIRQADPECYKVSLQVAGSSVLIHDDREAELGPGDLALYDTTRPYRLQFNGPFRMIVMMFPRSLLQVRESSVRTLSGRRIPGDHGLARLIGPFVSGLSGEIEQYAKTGNRSLCDAVLDLLAATLTDELNAGSNPSTGLRRTALLEQIKTYIDEQLADPDLGPATIAAAQHISPRYLRKLFEGDGDSVARWIRSRRLEHCRRDLTRPELGDKSVSAVASRWGFTDAAHFSRLFRSAFGHSPREYRNLSTVPGNIKLSA